MNEVRRARKLVERGSAIVEDQRQRIERLRAIGASTGEAVKMLGTFETTLSAFECHMRMKQAEMPWLWLYDRCCASISTSRRIMSL